MIMIPLVGMEALTLTAMVPPFKIRLLFNVSTPVLPVGFNWPPLFRVRLPLIVP